MGQAPAAQELTGFRPIFAWPPVEPGELEAAKEQLPKLLPGTVDPEDSQLLELAEPDATFMGGDEAWEPAILVPRDILVGHQNETEGRRLLEWADAVALALGRRQLRFGYQEKSGIRQETRLLLGFSEALTYEENELLHETKLRQRQGAHDRSPSQMGTNADGTQTVEYRGSLKLSADQRLERLSSLVMKKIAPRFGNIITCMVDMPLEPSEELPSLFEN